MLPSIEQFRDRIRKLSETDLKQTLENCRGQEEYVHAVLEELNARCPGWDKPRIRRGGSRATFARFRTKKQEFETARAAYIWLVERFTEVNPSLFTDIRWETTGYVGVGRRRTANGAARNYFAKSPKKLFRQTPSLADTPSNFHRLTNGWYVNLNLNTRENFEILCRFSSVSGLVHDTDWDWEVLDPSDHLHDSRHRFQLGAELQKEIEELLRQAPSAKH
jgi:hypothetical protein